MSDETKKTLNDSSDHTDHDHATENVGPQVGIIGQYIKDLSFENPTPAHTLQKLATEKPAINVNVSLNARTVGEDLYEVDMKINTTAKSGEETAFVAELVYSGLFAVKNLPENTLQPFLMIEAPRQLFPFARRIISDVTRDGGFPPLMLEPIDFARLYQQQLAAAQQKSVADDAAATDKPVVN